MRKKIACGQLVSAAVRVIGNGTQIQFGSYSSLVIELLARIHRASKFNENKTR